MPSLEATQTRVTRVAVTLAVTLFATNLLYVVYSCINLMGVVSWKTAMILDPYLLILTAVYSASTIAMASWRDYSVRNGVVQQLKIMGKIFRKPN